MTDNREQHVIARHYEEMRANEQQIEEYKLDRAVRLGLEQARRTRSRRGISACRTRIGYGALAAVLLTSLAALLILAPNQNPGGNAAQKGVSGPAASLNPAAQPPDYAIKQIDSHKDWKKALEHGLYQPINQTQEKNGYRVTVDGILADSMVAIVFYSTKNLDGNVPISLMRPTLFNKDVPSPAMFDTPSFGPDPNNSSIAYGRSELYYVNSLSDSVPDSFIFGGYWGNKALPEKDQPLIEFSIHPELNKDAVEKIIPFNQSVKAEGDTITIKEALMGPLHTWIVVDTSKSINQIDNLYQSKLTIGSGDKLVHLYPYFNPPYFRTAHESDKLLLPFEGGVYEEDTSTLTFTANGIERSTVQNRQITINTDTKQVIQASDNRLTLEDIQKQDGEIQLDLSIKSSEDGENKIKSRFSLDDAFKDSNGDEFNFTISKVSHSKDDSAYRETIVLKDRPYQQPLTFTVPFYKGATIDIPITAEGKEKN